jgi:phosphoglycolate phosphatase
VSARSLKLIGIDLDGTLEDSRLDMVAAAQRVRAGLNLAARSDAALRPHVNGGMDALYRACFDDYLADADPARYASVRSAYEADYLANVANETRLYPGILAALQELAELGTLACVTNKPERISRRLLEALDVAQLFGAVIGGDTGPHSKPHPSMLQAAAERCNFDRQRGQAFMIGDTNADIQLGHAFGARSVWCAWGYADSISESPDFRAEQPSELARIIAG